MHSCGQLGLGDTLGRNTPHQILSFIFQLPNAHPAVDEAAVIGLPDVDWGQKIAAFVALRPGKTASADELAEFCRQRLASFKKPELICFVEALPKNPLGKILKKELRAQFAE